MKSSFSSIAEIIENSKIKSVVNDSLSFSEELFKEIRKTLPKDLPIVGFTSVQKVPFHSFGKLTIPICNCKFYCHNKIARLILKGWYLKNGKSIDIIKNKLSEIGYEISIPDFDSNQIELEILKQNDIFETEEECSFFRPNGEIIDGINDIDATISAALLGWITVPLEDNDNLDIEDDMENMRAQCKNEIIKSKELELLKQTKENINGNEIEIHYSENDSSFETSFELLLSKSKEEGDYFLKVGQKLIDGIIPNKDQINSRIVDLSRKFDSLKEKIDSKEIAHIDSIIELKEYYLKSLERDNALKEERELIHNILNKILSISVKRGKTPTYIESLFAIANNFKEQLISNDCHNEEWFLEMIIQRHFLNFIIQAILQSNVKDHDFTELDLLLDKIKTEFTNHQIDFYEPLTTDINRNNLMFTETRFPDTPHDKSVGNSKKPADNEIKADKSNNSIIQELKPEKEKTAIKTAPPLGLKETEKVKVTNSNPTIPIEPPIINPISNPNPEVENTDNKQIAETISPDTLTKDLKTHSHEEELEVEDSTILDLLDRNEPEIAYHLAKCYELENKKLLISSNLLANLFLSLRIRTSEGPIASMIAANINNYDLTFEKKIPSRFKNQLIFSSILRPSIFAFNTSGAGLILDEVNLGKMFELSEIKRMILDFMNQYDGILNFDTLSQIFSKTQLKVQQEDFFIKIVLWLEKAQVSKYRGQPRNYCSVIFNNWVKSDGWLSGILAQFSNKPDIRIIKQLLYEELEDSSWKKRFDKELKAIDNYGRDFKDKTEAIKWVKNQIDFLKDLLKERLVCGVDSENIASNHQDEVSDFVRTLKKEIARIIPIINTYEDENTFSRIANKFLKKALNNLLEVLSGNEAGGQLKVNDNIFYAPLLNLPYYESGIGWEPKQYDHILKNSIFQYLKTKPQTTIEISNQHLKNGNIEAYNRLITFLNYTGKEVKQVEKYDDFIGRLKFESQNALTAIERGCSFGYLSDEIRTKLISSLEAVSVNKNKVDGINYPLSISKIDNILSEIELLKTNIIREYEKLIPDDIKPNEREALKSYLNKGNILVFNETIERIHNGQFEMFEESSGMLKHFFQVYLSHPNKSNQDIIMHAVYGGLEFYGIDFSGISEIQQTEAQSMISSWTHFKRLKSQSTTDDFEYLNSLLDGLGFRSPIFSESHSTKRRKSFFYDFKCDPIKGKSRSPIPQFGSIAKGNYRLVIIKERLIEEDLVEEIKGLSPETDRAVIVFNLCWMDQQSRLEVARLSKKNRITCLLLDEAMLVYLFSIKGSKLPAFIKLATPFTFIEPYQTSSSNLPEEMFYGRSAQIQKLKNITGDFSCLIYGGRQLGKTVLQREVERVFHNPQINNYAKYIDLRESGIGTWNPIEKITTVLIENLKFIPGLISDKISPVIKLDALLLKFKEWFDKNKEARIILFLDESDKFLEQDAEMDWRHIVQLKGLMEKTNKHFKIILAGLHDVRRTNTISNSPLAHFGNPICIGPMLDKDEAIEAQMLIKTPLETLGYEFETEDLVLMILSHCNWYPSLIQIFCSKLLNVLHEKHHLTQLPIIITENDVTKAYDKSRDIIKEKFSLTLSLDERYDLLANIIAGETIDNPKIQSTGISLEDITELAIIAWPSEFESTNPQIVVCNFLEEMVDLGVLRLVSKANFALRTPNLRDLIGTCKQIKDNLNKVRTKPQEFKRLTSRIIYNPTGKREQRSPIPAFFYDKIMDADTNVLIFRGSKTGGLDYIEDFLTNRKKVLHLIYPALSTDNSINYNSLIETLDKKRVQGIHNIIFINHTVKYTVEDVMFLKEKISRRTDLSALFLMSPEQTWEIMSKNDKSFEKLVNHNIPVICIPQWDEEVAKDWFKETGCVTAKIKDIFEVTGDWHSLLDKYHELIINNPEKWKEHLVNFDNAILSKKQEILTALGLGQQSALKLIQELIEWDGEISKHELINDYHRDDNPIETKNYLEYFQCLNLINSKLKVNNVVKRLINHG